VQYPAPGPNGEPQTYTGNFSYSTTTTTGQSATTTTSHSYNTNTTVSFSFGVSFAPLLGVAGAVFANNLSAGFNFSFSNGNGYSYSSAETNTVSSESGTTNSAAYSITGPQSSDNYTGPVTFNVYKDNVYGTFAFYSDEQRQQPPIQLSVVSGQAPIGVSTTTNFGTVQVGSTSTTQTVTLTNNSPYPMTMVAPAVTFSDPGFQIVPGLDFCSNVQLEPNGTPPYACTMTIEFAPALSDAPNTISSSYAIHAYLTAAGTENVSAWENILVTNPGAAVSGTATPAAATCTNIKPYCNAGATLLPATENTNQQNVYDFTTPSTYAPQTEQFTFKNYYSSSVTFPTYPADIVLSDPADFSVLNVTGSLDGCSGATVVSGGTCSFTLQYVPTTAPPPSGVFGTKITAMGTVTGSASAPLAFGGAAGTVISNIFTLSPSSVVFTQIGGDYWAQVALNITNNTKYPISNLAIPQVYVGSPPPYGYFTYGYMTGTYFAVTANCPTGTATLAAGATCTADFIFYNETTPVGTHITGTAQLTGSLNNADGTLSPVSAGIPYSTTVINDIAVKLTLSGAEKSKTVTIPAKPGEASLTLSGKVGSAFTGTRHVELTVGGFKAEAWYSDTATIDTVAKALARAANALGSPVTATVSGDVVKLTSKVAGKAGNIAYTTINSADFALAPSTGSLTGGVNEETKTEYDSGSIDAAIGGVTASTKWGEASTLQTIAGDVAAALNSAAKGALTASAKGDTVTIVPVPNKSGSKPSTTVSVKDEMGFDPASFAAAMK
jgi:hypothetical protein